MFSSIPRHPLSASFVSPTSAFCLSENKMLKDVRAIYNQIHLLCVTNLRILKAISLSMTEVIVETRGRKKVVGDLTPPACDPRDVETIERLQQRIQELELQQLQQDSPAEEAKTEYHDDPIRSIGLKIEIPEFTSKVHPEDFIDWLSTVKRVFDVRDIPDKLKVKLVAIKLRQHASLWWDHVNKRRRIEGKSKVDT
ncbi:hypothetical protein Tco_1501178 [Tanacetum coccineum]